MLRVNSFNPVASRYSKKVAPRRFAQFLTLIHELDLEGYERVLDIGTGPGELSIQIANQLEAGGFLHGIDLSANMIRMAKRIAEVNGRTNVLFDRGDALNLAFEDASFDVVVTSNAYPWVPDRPRFLREVYRVLKPGGKFALVALSNKCYREFGEVFKKVSDENPGLFPEGKPFEIMGAKLHTLSELGRAVERVGFDVKHRFVLSTEEPIGTQDYIDRVNAIVHENYLDHLTSTKRQKAQKLIVDKMSERNGELRITESSVFVIAEK